MVMSAVPENKDGFRARQVTRPRAQASAGLIHTVPGVAGGSVVDIVTPESLTTTSSESMSTLLRLRSLSGGETTELRRLLEIPPVGFLRLTPEVGRATVRQHLAIVTAIETGDDAAAAAAMSLHLDDVLRHSTDPTPIEEP